MEVPKYVKKQARY